LRPGVAVVVVDVDGNVVVVVVVLDVGIVLTGVPPDEPAGLDVATKSAPKSAAGRTTLRIVRDRTGTPSSQR
jgi:hypothetical protein